MKKTFLNTGGFTLIEIVVSLMILGIIAVAFLPVFSNSFAHIMSAGKRSKADYAAQKAIENRLAGSGATFDHINTSENTTVLTIDLGPETIVVQGKTVNVTYDDGKQKVTLTTFIPN